LSAEPAPYSPDILITRSSDLPMNQSPDAILRPICPEGSVLQGCGRLVRASGYGWGNGIFIFWGSPWMCVVSLLSTFSSTMVISPLDIFTIP
jgi:hypothetical protein